MGHPITQHLYVVSSGLRPIWQSGIEMKRILLRMEVLHCYARWCIKRCIVLLKNSAFCFTCFGTCLLTICGILKSEMRQIFGVNMKENATTTWWTFLQEIKQLCKKTVNWTNGFLANLDNYIKRYEKEWDNTGNRDSSKLSDRTHSLLENCHVGES